jgi:3-oxoacyl-[acyl-carrier-protein] synthase I
MYVIAAGMTSCVGADAESACAAFRCRIAGFRELPYRDIRSRPLVGAPVHHVDSQHLGGERLLDLVVPALHECISRIEEPRRSGVSVVLACPPGFQDEEAGLDLRTLEKAVGMRLSDTSRLVVGGATAAIVALEYAAALLKSGQEPVCVVGGVDSLLDERQVRTMERLRRLKQDGNPHGMIPGEGACVLLCAPAPGQPRPSLRIAGWSRAQDEGGVRSTALSTSLRQAIAAAGLANGDVGTVLTDLTGERELSVDYAIALTRVFTQHQDKLHAWHIAMSVGHIGAAAIPTQIAWWLAAGRRGYAPGASAACLALSDVGWRGAVVLTAEQR